MDKIILENFKKINEGLVHEIFLEKGRVYKRPKDNFKDFQNVEHFEIEKKTLELLKKNGLPAVEIFEIYVKDNKPILVEEFVKDGYQKNKKEINYKEKKEILTLLRKVHKIKLKGFGIMKKNLEGRYKSWRSFLKYSLRANLNYLVSKKIYNLEESRNILLLCNKYIEALEYNEKGSLILSDINPMNLFFKDNKIIKIIDLDHPLIGDSLYEYSAIKWYYEDLFKVYLKNNTPKRDDFIKILFYEIIHGISVIAWEYKNGLNILKDLEKIKSIQKEIQK
jgi:hypothetical protein